MWGNYTVRSLDHGAYTVRRSTINQQGAGLPSVTSRFPFTFPYIGDYICSPSIGMTSIGGEQTGLHPAWSPPMPPDNTC